VTPPAPIHPDRRYEVAEHTAIGRVDPAPSSYVSLVIITQGAGFVRSDECVHRVQAGQALVIPRNLRWSGTTSFARFFHVLLDHDFLEKQFALLEITPRTAAYDLCRDWLSDALDAPLRVIDLGVATAHSIIPTLRRLHTEQEQPQNSPVALFEAAELLAVIAMVKSAGSAQPLPVAGLSALGLTGFRTFRPDIDRVLDLVQSTLDQGWSVAELARQVPMSTSQLTRLFITEVGLTPGTYLRVIRALRMADELVLSSLSISDIAQHVGWDSVSQASRVFHAMWGMPPSEFRRRHATYRGRLPA